MKGKYSEDYQTAKFIFKNKNPARIDGVLFIWLLIFVIPSL